jgi:hypothetical protein
MSHIPFNFESFASAILQAEKEREVEEHLGMIRDYIDDLIYYCHEIELDKMNLQTEVDDLQSRVIDLECQIE